MFDNSVMNLTGGQLPPFPAPPTFHLEGSSVLNVYGAGLSLTSLGGPYWELQGTLQDGTPIPSNTEIWAFGAAVNLYQVPEPSAILLAALAFVGAATWRWRLRRNGDIRTFYFSAERQSMDRGHRLTTA